MRFLALRLTFVVLFVAGCGNPLASLPDDTNAFLNLSFDGERVAFADLTLQTSACIALDPATLVTLNGVQSTTFEPGGRGRDPISAFNPSCIAPMAWWDLFDTQVEDASLVMESGDVSLRMEVDANGAVTRCDFPSCQAQLFR